MPTPVVKVFCLFFTIAALLSAVQIVLARRTGSSLAIYGLMLFLPNIVISIWIAKHFGLILLQASPARYVAALLMLSSAVPIAYVCMWPVSLLLDLAPGAFQQSPLAGPLTMAAASLMVPVIVWCSLSVLVLRWNPEMLLWMLASMPVAVALSYGCQLLIPMIPIDGSVILELLFAFSAVLLSGWFGVGIYRASPI